ncbi:DMT family transporter [Microbacterium sp. A93]|uniref:DMT family transporter n=1 Tax=Microbacterium sp. A93 TaxID=3450716 RepID=UPI003F43391E
MENNSRHQHSVWRTLRWPLIAAIGPIVFGSTYWVTHEFLPADSPLWGSAIRALPAGLVLLLVVRRLPHGAWWWRSIVLGTLNMGLFFCLVYVAAQLLPSSVAASITSVAPLMIAGFAWLILHERPTARVLLGAGVGAAGVLLIVGTATGRLDAWGIAASFASMAMSALGAILMKRWNDGTPVLTVTAWQLIVGGIELTVAASLFEGAPPAVSPSELIAFGYVSLIATALGFFCWFSGFRHLPAGVVGVIGLLNPVTGVALGVAISGETLSALQLLGIALVLGSIVLANVRRRQHSAHAELGLHHDSGSTEQNQIGIVCADFDLQALDDRRAQP